MSIKQNIFNVLGVVWLIIGGSFGFLLISFGDDKPNFIFLSASIAVFLIAVLFCQEKKVDGTVLRYRLPLTMTLFVAVLMGLVFIIHPNFGGF